MPLPLAPLPHKPWPEELQTALEQSSPDVFGQARLTKARWVMAELEHLLTNPSLAYPISLLPSEIVATLGPPAIPSNTLRERSQHLRQVFLLVERLVEVWQGKEGETEQEAARQLFLSLPADLETLLLLLVEALVSLHFLLNKEPSPQTRRYARFCLDVFSPLANRLGIRELKWRLEDACLRLLEPQAYQDIARFLAAKRGEREAVVAEVKTQLENHLAAVGIKVQVSGRAKHIYSIWKKWQRRSLDQIKDLFALRVVAESRDDCYRVLSVIQMHWDTIASDYSDYIARPKDNGYQSLHVVVWLPQEKVPLEVQIRSRDMHHAAEHGVVSHWRYKEGRSGEIDGNDHRVVLLRQLLAWRHDTSLQESVPACYVLTPKGRVIELPIGGTVLDFAYRIHSDLGHRCRGALVDGAIVPLATVLNTGQTVEILAGKTGQPSRDWLQDNYTRSRHAKSKIRAWFNSQRRLPLTTTPTPSSSSVTPALKRLTTDQPERQRVTVQGVGNLLHSIAQCCKPQYGNAIRGYLATGRGIAKGISIHRRDCDNIARLQALFPERVVEASWD